MNLECPKAFDPFYDATATFTGTRRETGGTAARALKLAVPCCVLGGDQADSIAAAGAPSSEFEYVVMIHKSDWVDHLPPQRGDLVTVDGYPELRVMVSTPDKTDWAVRCRSKEVA